MSRGTSSAKAGQTLEIEGHTLKVGNLDKLFYPVAGFTKGQVIDYYIRIAPVLLPHLRDRPVTLKRYPDGIAAQAFYEKDAPTYTPKWIERFPVPRRSGESDICYILVNNLATLVWCANLATVEFHPFLHRVPDLNCPASVVFDLDPGEGAAMLECIETSFLLKEVLDHLGLQAWAKVSGSKGVQVYVPLNTAVTYPDTQAFARALAQLLEQRHPKLVISDMAKFKRKEKVFVDWSQNADFKTTVGVYSLRAKRQHPFVSMPVQWEELATALQSKDTGPLYFQPAAALERVESVGDLFAPVLDTRQALPREFSRQLAQFKSIGRSAPRSLETYGKKRNFSRTAEPAPAVPKPSRQGSRRRFVIQKHAASHLHYDFRLEMHGVLKSWAVPKGLPYALEDKRLAMATEDHPLAYLDFEGTIPKGEYGGGTVMVWDIGTYELIEGNYYKGNLHFHLNGKKLKGEWVIERNAGSGDKNWLLRKVGSAMRPISTKRDDSSAVTSRSMQQIAAANDAQWHSNRSEDLHRLPPARIEFIAPMQALLASQLPEGPGWQYEIKLDGYRALALRSKDGVRLLSRNNRVLDTRFPEIVEACQALPPDTIVDGEVTALDARGWPSFSALQNHQSGTAPIVYYVFDLLAWRGKSLLGLPLTRRKELLSSALADTTGPIRLLGSLDADARKLMAAANQQNVEGFVAKRSESVYEPGQRTGKWVKFKLNQSQELVIGGYMPNKQNFDSLLVGYYEDGALLFMAKVKNGFVPWSKQQVFARFAGLETAACPFANLPEPKGARRGEALTASVMKKCRWLKPELVAQVEFTDWTAANHLRHSRFVALRDDKDAREVVHEQAAARPV